MPSFLQTAFLTGMAALAVPILIHLFFHLKTKRVELGTIRFLRIVLEENARRRKVMRWLLLALRMAFVALLVGMFARPYFSAAATTGDKELLVILIDQSATMQLKGERGRLIEQSIAEAKRLVQSASQGTRIEVAFFDHVVRPVTATKPDEVTTASEVFERLVVPDASFGATNYGSAIAWARDICVKAPPGRKEFHLFTDLQRSGLDWREVEPLPAEVRSHLHDLGNPVVNNVAVTEVRPSSLWVRPGETPSVKVTIQHGGAFALTEVPIVLEVGRVEGSGHESVVGSRGTPTAPIATPEFSKLTSRITKRERVKLEPGANITLDFELPSLAEGFWQGRVVVEYDDDLTFDNQRCFAISATPAYRVLVVNGGEGGSSVQSETYFLETALRLAAGDSSFVESPFSPTALSYTAETSLPKLSAFDAVVLANVGDVRPADAGQLALFVKAGGGLLVFTGDNVSAKSSGALTDVGLDVGAIGKPKVTVDLPWRLAKWDASHPVFEPLSDPQYGDLRRLIFAAYTKLVPSAEARVLMEFGTGDPAVLERRVGEGIVLWVTISCGRDWSDWSRSRLFLPLLHQLLGYEVGLTQGGRVRMTLVDAEPKGELDEGRVAPDATTDVKTSDPQSGLSTTRTTDSPASSSAVLLPGLYSVGRYVEVVNTSPRESDVERCSRQELEDRFAVKFVDEDSSSTAHNLITSHVDVQRDEIWHWVACTLLAVLLLEGFVGNRTTA